MRENPAAALWHKNGCDDSTPRNKCYLMQHDAMVLTDASSACLVVHAPQTDTIGTTGDFT